MKGSCVIGVSKLAPNYEDWLRKLAPDLEIRDLYPMSWSGVKDVLPGLSGILLSGGSDIHPAMYNRAGEIDYCRDIDERRDNLEKMLVEQACREKTPVLGICRGLQILNVVMGGNLIADIPAFCSSMIHAGKQDVDHFVEVKAGTHLARITGLAGGMTNSSHHQAVQKIAPGFVASAFSEDGIVEAIEAGEGIDHPFCLAVQWHPERMYPDNPLSGLVGKAFLHAAGLT